MSLTIEQIRASRTALARQTVEVPELNGSITIRVLTQAEVAEMQKSQRTDGDAMAIGPRLLALACIKDDGSPMFVGEDVKVIPELPWPAVETIARAVMKLNRLDGETEAPKA